MALTVTATQGDTLDAVVWRHYGDSSMLPAVLAANRGLAALGPILPIGTRVILPDRQPTTPKQVTLW